MEATISKKVSLQETQKNFRAYFESHDVQYVAEDAVFINMGTGEETRGREAIGAMLHYFYHVAFDAHAETISYLVTEDRAMLEGYFTGRHIGEFAGIPATNREVRVPLRSEEHTSELQSQSNLVCRLLLEKKKKKKKK